MRRGTQTCLSSEIERARQTRGWSLETLAEKADLNIRTVKRMLAGRPAYFQSIAALASALGVSTTRLVNGIGSPNADSQYRPVRYTTSLSLEGLVANGQGIPLIDLPRRVVDILQREGISVMVANSSTAVDDSTRIIVTLLGLVDEGPAWLYVAVKPSQYRAFEIARDQNRVNFQDFERFGEVIVSGLGATPPPDVAAKVQQMYALTLDEDPAEVRAKIDRVIDLSPAPKLLDSASP